MKEDEKHLILVVEKEPWLIKKTFEIYDLSEEISKGQVLFACPNKKMVNELAYLIDSRFVINNWNVMLHPLANMWNDNYNEIAVHTFDLINQIQCNVGTVIGAGKEIAKNDIETFPYVVRHRGIAELQNLYKDKPAILVNTGPSLQKNIHIVNAFI